MESEIEEKTIENHVFETLGHASMCWSETPKGVFDSSEALKAGQELMKHINTDVPYACGIVFKALREQEDYYYAWQANIAMAFYDEFLRHREKVGRERMNAKDVHTIANQAAKNFLDLLIKPIENEKPIYLHSKRQGRKRIQSILQP